MKIAVFMKNSISQVPSQVLAMTKGHEILGVEGFGGQLFSSCIPKPKESLDYKDLIKAAVNTIIMDFNPDLFITVGGDGLASYVASELVGKDIKILGFGAGTANVGPIVTKIKDGVLFDDCETLSLDAIEVKVNNKVLGYAFNDVIIGNSLLGTIDSRVCNISAEALAKDSKIVETKPIEEIVSDSFCVKLNDQVLSLTHIDEIKQICVSTLQFDKLYGRAVLGGLCNGCGYEHPAALSLIDKIMVDSDPRSWKTDCFVTTKHLVFKEDDCVKLSGFTKDAQIIIDGNPFLRESNEIELKCFAGAIKTLRGKV